MIDRIEEIILEFHLNEKSRYRYIVHRRWYLFKLLRNNGVIYQRIAEMFNQSHINVIYGVKMANHYEKTNDKLYNQDTAKLQLEFAGVDFEQRDIIADVNNCKNFKELRVIKNRIKNCQYRNYKLEKS